MENGPDLDSPRVYYRMSSFRYPTIRKQVRQYQRNLMKYSVNMSMLTVIEVEPASVITWAGSVIWHTLPTKLLFRSTIGSASTRDIPSGKVGGT